MATMTLSSHRRLLFRSQRVRIFCSRSLFSTAGKQEDYLRDDGIVEGVWIFCRHGDRTPGRLLSPEHRRQEEGAYWLTRLPFPDSAAAYEAYSRYFPPDIHPGTNHGMFLDVARNPSGFLTATGLAQLKENGHRFFHRYNQHGHHFPDRKQWRWENAQDFLSAWDVHVYSTNYLRTIMSAQSFLDGLLGTNCFVSTGTRKYDPTIFRELRVPNHSWKRADYGRDTLVKVRVRELSHDPLNAFDRNPDLIAELVSEVLLSDDFQKRDGDAAPLAARLANILPGLVRPGRAGYSSRTPSGINWVEAADHFVCREAHGLGFSKFSDFEDDDQVEETLAAMSHQTISHLTWRFRKWYENKRLLGVVAAPPLREIAEQMKLTPAMGVREPRPFVLYACHDITILGLLYGIGADFLADANGQGTRYWPKYGSTLVFELVRIPKNKSGEDSYVVRVLLNGKPVRSVDFDCKNASDASLGHGPDRMMWIQDFLDKVSSVEDAGGHDYDALLSRQ